MNLSSYLEVQPDEYRHRASSITLHPAVKAPGSTPRPLHHSDCHNAEPKQADTRNTQLRILQMQNPKNSIIVTVRLSMMVEKFETEEVNFGGYERSLSAIMT